MVCGQAILALFMKKTSQERIILDKQISDALERFRSQVFPSLPENEPRDNNRVTIFHYYQKLWTVSPFRCVVWPWGIGRSPYSGWLAVLHRSGHQTQFTKTVFLAPDDAPKAEGVAGQAFRSESATRVRELPNINEIPYVSVLRACWYRLKRRVLSIVHPSADRQCPYFEHCKTVKTYADATYTSEAIVWRRIKRGKRNPISILAIPLETPDNIRWGVLVMDSSNNFECKDTADKKFLTAMRELGKTLISCGIGKGA